MGTPCNYVEEEHHEKAMHKTKDHDNAQQQQKMMKTHVIKEHHNKLRLGIWLLCVVNNDIECNCYIHIQIVTFSP